MIKKEHILDDKITIGQVSNIIIIAEIVQKSLNSHLTNKDINTAFELIDVSKNSYANLLDNTKKNGYKLSKLIHHLTEYALENPKFQRLINRFNS